MNSRKLLQVKSLEADFLTEDGWVPALRDISFDVDEGGCTGVVGESGCGKSVTALAIMGILPPNVRIKRGEIIFEGRDLLKASAAERSGLRGSAISMIFQDALSALNPVFTVGDQMRDILRTSCRKQQRPALTQRQADDEIVAMLDQVGLSSPRQRLKQYPHELSGGMRQRVLIAITLLSRPRLVIADEPTTALDVTIEAQIVELIQELAQKFNVTFMLITHNFNLVAELCDRVVVLYRGHSVEECRTEALFREPLHPYTQGLLNSIITPATRRGQLRPIAGAVPNAREVVPGCQFNPRCPAAMDVCRAKAPAFVALQDQRRVACFLRSAVTAA
jgi:oligopeptide/dipeptide ABC transporter ATP-binding protein